MTTDEKVAKVMGLVGDLVAARNPSSTAHAFNSAFITLKSAIRELADPVKVPKGFVERLRERNNIDCDIAAAILEKLPQEVSP